MHAAENFNHIIILSLLDRYVQYRLGTFWLESDSNFVYLGLETRHRKLQLAGIELCIEKNEGPFPCQWSFTS